MYYNEDGYIDVDRLMAEDKSVFKFIVGARGIGKTFGILKWLADNYRKTGERFIYLRRTQIQTDMVKTAELNPFKSLCNELGKNYDFIFSNINKNVTGIYPVVYDTEKDEFVADSAPIGFMAALSTIANIRGFSGDDIHYIFYDEFIGERHEKIIRSEGTAFLNAIETIGRNRELKGGSPLNVICVSNSVNLANPLFIELKFITPIEKAINRKQDHIFLPERNASIYIVNDSPISKKKEETSLYQLAGTSSDFSQMSLKNEFNKEYMGMVKSMSLKQFRPVCMVGELVIYKHKSELMWYITDHLSGSPPVYDSSEIEIKRWRNDYYYLKLSYLNRHIYFESYIQQAIFEQYIKV